MRSTSSFARLLFFALFAAGLLAGYAAFSAGHMFRALGCVAVGLASALFVLLSVNVAAPWERAVVLRLGRFRALRGPGLFCIIPVIDTIPYWIDVRVITSSFKAEKTLTKDTV